MHVLEYQCIPMANSKDSPSYSGHENGLWCGN